MTLFHPGLILNKENNLPEKIKQQLHFYSNEKSNYLFFMIDTRERRMLAVFDIKNLVITDAIDIDPAGIENRVKKPANQEHSN